MTKPTQLLSALGCQLALVSSAHAGGFLLTNHGANATGRANAVSATVNDGSAIFHNPAGIGQTTEPVNFYLGGQLISPDSSFTLESTGESYDAQTSTSYTPSLYAYGAVGEMVRWGIGVYAPYGSRLGWEQGAPGNDITTEQALQTLFISPVLAFDLSQWAPGLTLAGGMDFVPSSVELRQDVIFGSDEGTAHLGGSGFGIGARAGIQYQPPTADKWSFGVAWRSAVTLDMSGDADFDAPSPYRSQLPPDGGINADIKLPQSVSGGVAFRPADDFELELNATWVGWSRFDEIAIDLDSGSSLVSDRGYEDIVTFSLGAEHSLTDIGLDVRAGYQYDPTPIPDAKLTVALPDIDRHIVTLGSSYRFSDQLFADLGIFYVLPGENETGSEPFEPQIKGTYDVQALVLALSVGGAFGGTSEARSNERLVANGAADE